MHAGSQDCPMCSETEWSEEDLGVTPVSRVEGVGAELSWVPPWVTVGVQDQVRGRVMPCVVFF